MRFELVQIDTSGLADAVDAYEVAGLETIAFAEAYAFDAAKTRTIGLTSNVSPLYIRTPSLTTASVDSPTPGGSSTRGWQSDSGRGPLDIQAQMFFAFGGPSPHAAPRRWPPSPTSSCTASH